MTHDLKPCPMCGRSVSFACDAELVPYGVVCHNCHAITRFTRERMKNDETYGDVMGRIADRWNRRTST